MQLIKQYTAVFLTAVLLLTLFPCCSAATAAPATAGGTLEKLGAFGILTDKEMEILATESPLTRGDFIRLAVRLSGMDPTSVAGKGYRLPFVDVEQSDANYRYLCTAYEIGLIEGYSGAALRPGDPVTLDEAAKLLVTVLGYKPIAMLQGGYPTGYRIIASQLKLFAGCGSLEEITGPDAAILVENTLDAPMAKEVRAGDTVSFDTSKDNILLAERFGIYQTEGVLDGTEITTLLTGYSTVPRGFVTIGGEPYLIGSTQAADWLGYAVECYYQDEPGQDRTLVFITPKENRNQTLEIDAEHILSADARHVTYADANGKRKTQTIFLQASFIYNGKQTAFSANLLKSDCGSLTLVDNNGDGTYEVLLMTAYRTIVAASVSATAYTVTDYLGGKAVQLEEGNQDYRIHMTMNGAPVTINELKQWDVLSYAESADAGIPLKTVLISRESVVGTVTAISPDDKKVEIDDEMYDVSGSLLERLKLGEEGTFCFDVFGRVVALNGERKMVYGYVKAGKKQGIDTYVLKIFTENNHWVELPLRSKLRFNGVASCPAEEVFRALLKDKTVMPQLIAYRVSADRQVNELSTALDIPVGSAEEAAAIQNSTFRKSMTLGSITYRNYSGSMSFEDRVCVKDAKIFFIPPKPAEASDELFAVGGVSRLEHDMTYTNVVAFDVDELRCAAACTTDKRSAFINQGNDPIMVVTDVNEAIDDLSEPIYAIHGLYNGTMTSVYTANKEVVDSIKLRKGDVVQFARNDDGYVDTIVRQFSAENGFAQKGMTGGAYHSATRLRGQVVKADAERKKMIIDYGAEPGVYSILGNPVVYVYDAVHNRGTTGTVNDIVDGDYIFYLARYFDIRAIVIFKEY